MRKKRPVKDRFESHIFYSPDGCHYWTGAPTTGGYGVFAPVGSRAYLAHRIAYELNHGPIPAKMLVCHRCDNRLCVNPDHLFLGSHHDNLHDMIKKGRGNYQKDSSFTCAKLDEEDVSEILKLKGRFSSRLTAKIFHVERTTIQKIWNKQTWKHI